jgi:transcription elongation factor Elf1
MRNSNFSCPVCGYSALDEPAYDKHGSATFVICPSCGTEFGYDDSSVAHRELRRRWIDAGMNWASKAAASPPGWNPLDQLRSARMLD